MNAAAGATGTPSPGGVEHYRREWDAAHGSLPGAGLAWLEEVRGDAIERFCRQGFPTPRDEDWKYTNVRTLERRAFQLATEDDDASSAANLTAQIERARVALARPPAASLVFVNGRAASDDSGAASTTPTLPEGVRVESLARLLATDPAAIEPHLTALGIEGATGASAFSALNHAFLADGAVILLSPGAHLEDPIELVFAANADEGHFVSYPFVFVLAPAGARATIIEHHQAFGAGAKFVNPFTRVVVETDADIEHHLLLEEDDATWHTGRVEARVAPGGRFGSHATQLGGRMVRCDIDVSLNGTGAATALNGLYVARGRQHVDFHTRVDHLEPGGTSEQCYKGLLDGHGRGVFNGRVLVHRDAQHSSADQSNHNLLLSDNAEIDTKPQLEIFADDVKCSHGATVGQLDEEAIHYARARGLSDEAARALLTFGFAEDVLDRMGAPAIRRHVERRLEDALPALASLPPRDETLPHEDEEPTPTRTES